MGLNNASNTCYLYPMAPARYALVSYDPSLSLGIGSLFALDGIQFNHRGKQRQITPNQYSIKLSTGLRAGCAKRPKNPPNQYSIKLSTGLRAGCAKRPKNRKQSNQTTGSEATQKPEAKRPNNRERSDQIAGSKAPPKKKTPARSKPSRRFFKPN